MNKIIVILALLLLQCCANSNQSKYKTVIIYDPIRESNELIKRGLGLMNGTCTFDDLSNC